MARRRKTRTSKGPCTELRRRLKDAQKRKDRDAKIAVVEEMKRNGCPPPSSTAAPS